MEGLARLLLLLLVLWKLVRDGRTSSGVVGGWGSPEGCAQKSVIRWNECNVQLTHFRDLKASRSLFSFTRQPVLASLIVSQFGGINLSTTRLSEVFQDAELWLLKTSFMETVLCGREAGPQCYSWRNDSGTCSRWRPVLPESQWRATKAWRYKCTLLSAVTAENAAELWYNIKPVTAAK